MTDANYVADLQREIARLEMVVEGMKRQLRDKLPPDAVPVRLGSGRRAYLVLPDPLSEQDAEHVCRWVRLHVGANTGAGER
jgi:hypothetical protein